MGRQPKWQVRGPYEDGTFALIERVGSELYGRAMRDSRAACLTRRREILAQRRAASAKETVK